MRKGLTAVVAVAATAAVAVPALAADGDLDTSFGTDGVSVVAVGDTEYPSSAHDVIVDGTGSSILVGSADNGDGTEWGLAKLDPNGDLDESFGNGGTKDDWIGNGGTAHAVDLQDDGMIVVAGDASRPDDHLNELAVGRYRANGQRDTTFGDDAGNQRTVVGDIEGGIARAYDVEVLSDGDIVVVGYGTWRSGDFSRHRAVAARYNPDGSPDEQFGGDGVVDWFVTDYNNRATSVAEAPGGGIIVGGTAEHEMGEEDLAFWKLTRTGAWDTTFGGGDGSLLIPVGEAEDREATVEGIALDADGRIVAAGTLDDDEHEAVVARVTPQGAPDASFGDGGVVRTAVEDDWADGRDVAVRPDGAILVTGSFGAEGLALAKYDEDGDLDGAFGGDGIASAPLTSGMARSLALNADGTRAVIAGAGGGRFAASRFVLEQVEEKPTGGGEKPKEERKQDTGQQPAAEQQQAPAPAAGRAAPAPRRCTSRRVFRINLRRLGIVRGDAVFRGKVQQSRLKGDGRAIRVDLRRLAPGRYVVDVVGLRKNGRQVKVTKRYRTCRPRR